MIKHITFFIRYLVLILGVSSFSHASETEFNLSEATQKWQDLKFGMFIHWGLYSIPAGTWNGEKVEVGYSEQIQSHGKIPKADYIALADEFNPTLFNAGAIAKLAKQAGMKYIVLTAKHHDGFNMFDTKQSNYNVVDATPYAKDVLLELAKACKDEGLGLGIYFSLIDWNFKGALPMTPHNSDEIPLAHEKFNLAQVEELMTQYGDIVEVWFDMGKPTLEQSKALTNLVHKHQPNALVSGRIWNNQGDFLVMGDNYIPDYKMREPWETPASIYHATWGYREWQVRDELNEKVTNNIQSLVKVVSRGGNYLLNIGPKADGSVVKFEAEVLRNIGKWMTVNSESIYGAKLNPFDYVPEFGDITAKAGKLYLHVMSTPKNNQLKLSGLTNKITKAYLLADKDKKKLKVTKDNQNQIINLPIIESIEWPLNANIVVVVEYEKTLNIEPSNPITVDKNGEFSLTNSNSTNFFSQSGADYYSTKKTIIERQWAFENEQSNKYTLSYQCVTSLSALEANYTLRIDNQIYTIQCGNEDKTIVNKRLQTLTIPAGYHKVNLTLAKPKFQQQDLSLQELSISLKLIN